MKLGIYTKSEIDLYNLNAYQSNKSSATPHYHPEFPDTDLGGLFRSHGKVACRAVEDDKSTDAASIELTNNLSSIGIGLVWLGFVGKQVKLYATIAINCFCMFFSFVSYSFMNTGLLLAGYVLLLSPTQSPVRDQYFIEKLVGIAEPGGPEINAVFTALFNIMGIWPAIYTALLVPSGKSGNKVGLHDLALDNEIQIHQKLIKTPGYALAHVTRF